MLTVRASLGTASCLHRPRHPHRQAPPPQQKLLLLLYRQGFSTESLAIERYVTAMNDLEVEAERNSRL